MSETSDNLEARLSGLRLRPASAGLEERIAAELGEERTGKSTCPCHPELAENGAGKRPMDQAMRLHEPASPEARASRRGDRWLWSAITSGAIAACVIVAMLIVDARSVPGVARLPLVQQGGPTMSAGPALASAAQSWGDELGHAFNGSRP